jgi:hypothetical protein
LTDGNDREFGSPNSIVWRYFACLRRLAREAGATSNRDLQRESSALAVFMAVSAIEAFFNIWFRTFSEAGPMAAHRRARIMADLKSRKGVAHKFKAWPRLCSPKGFNLNRPPGKTFLALVDQRNALMHFTTDYDSIEAPGMTISGLVDITTYQRLSASDAVNAVRVAEEIVGEFFRLQKLSAEAVLKQMHYWTMRVPSQTELAEARRQDAAGEEPAC